MCPHMMYVATPKTYYYFRPYNHMHIRQHQIEAGAWGADWSNPYSNALFDDVYTQIGQ